MDENGFVDIHFHALPGLDDGADDIEEAATMLGTAADDGAAAIVITPHGGFRRRWQSIDELRLGYARLADTLAGMESAPSLMLGMENPIEPDLARALERGEALTLNDSRYALIELPFLQLPLFWEHAFEEMRNSGYTAVIAHPERQQEIQGAPAIVERMSALGALVQVTAGSLLGHFGRLERLTAEWLVDRGLVDLIASDAHGSQGARSPAALAAAYEAVSSRKGSHVAQRFFVETPAALVANQRVGR